MASTSLISWSTGWNARPDDEERDDDRHEEDDRREHEHRADEELGGDVGTRDLTRRDDLGDVRPGRGRDARHGEETQRVVRARSR